MPDVVFLLLFKNRAHFDVHRKKPIIQCTDVVMQFQNTT